MDLNDFFKKVDATVVETPKKRGRPPNPKFTPKPKVVKPTYTERMDHIEVRVRLTRCTCCASIYRSPLGTFGRLREYTATGKLRTKAGINSPLIRWTLLLSMSLIPKGLPVTRVEEEVIVLNCEECVISTYEGTQLSMPLSPEEDQGELRAYADKLTLTDATIKDRAAEMNPLASQVLADLRQIQENYKQFNLPDAIGLAAYYPDLMIPKNWLETAIEDIDSHELNEWLDNRKATKDST